ncbi:MAG: hypothetical protein H6922_05295 [Pseudomonadaceae bacterium]|nr:hypothetical protein [Pseudomonadaceae bacterium]
MSDPHLHGPANIPQNATHALVCLHGFGDEGASYLGLQAALQALLPENVRLAIACPNGPFPTPFNQGYQWFSDAGWTFNDPTGMAATHTRLATYLEDLHTGYTIPYENIALLGFSQGAMQGLYSIPRLPWPIGGFIACAGALTPAAKHRPDPLPHTPMLLLHGVDDDVLPADKTLEAAQTLTDWGLTVEHHLIPRLAHGINNQSLAHIGVFLQTIWKS